MIYSMATSTADEARPLRGRDRRQPDPAHAGLPAPRSRCAWPTPSAASSNSSRPRPDTRAEVNISPVIRPRTSPPRNDALGGRFEGPLSPRPSTSSPDDREDSRSGRRSFSARPPSHPHRAWPAPRPAPAPPGSGAPWHARRPAVRPRQPPPAARCPDRQTSIPQSRRRLSAICRSSSAVRRLQHASSADVYGLFRPRPAAAVVPAAAAYATCVSSPSRSSFRSPKLPPLTLLRATVRCIDRASGLFRHASKDRACGAVAARRPAHRRAAS